MCPHLTPAQGRLLRLLKQRQAFLIRQGVTGWRFSLQAAGTAWGKPLREDTVMGLVKAGLLTRKQAGRGRVEFHLAQSPEVGKQEGLDGALAAQAMEMTRG